MAIFPHFFTFVVERRLTPRSILCARCWARRRGSKRLPPCVLVCVILCNFLRICARASKFVRLFVRCAHTNSPTFQYTTICGGCQVFGSRVADAARLLDKSAGLWYNGTGWHEKPCQVFGAGDLREGECLTVRANYGIIKGEE